MEKRLPGDANRKRLEVIEGGNSPKESVCGPIWGSRRLYRCNNCGNTRIFKGEVVLKAVFICSMVDAFLYDVMQYSLWEKEANHVVTTCLRCGSHDITATEVVLDQELLDDFCTLLKFGRKFYKKIDPINPSVNDTPPVRVDTEPCMKYLEANDWLDPDIQAHVFNGQIENDDPE